MKFLINQEFKVLRRGDYVVADESVGEFIYDTEGTPLHNGTAQEVAEANGFKISKKLSKADYTTKLNEELLAMNAPEQNTPTESQRVEEIVKAGYDAGKNDDAIMVDLVQSGISFKKVSKMFKAAVESLGLRVSNKDVATQASEILAAMDFDPKTGADVKAAVEAITAKIEKADPKQALAAVRKYAKANGFELPKAPKGEKRVAGVAGGFRGKFVTWVMSNPTATLEECKEWLAAQEKPEALQKRFASWFEIIHAFHAAQ